MAADGIGEAVRGAANYLAAHPENGRAADAPARAVIEGLRCTVVGPDGAVVTTDMPASVGGEGSAPTPGWFLRAALASCDATAVAMRAAHEGIELDVLEVVAESESDDRGLLGVGDDVAAGPLEVKVTVRIGASGVAPDRLRDIVEWARRHSPVGDALERSIPTTLAVEVVEQS